MNHSIQFAQETTGKTTAKQLLAALKKGTNTYLHGHIPDNRPSYSSAFCFTLSITERMGKGETITTIEVPGYVSNGNTSVKESHRSEYDGQTWDSYSETYAPKRGYWSVSRERLRDAVELLPGNAEVAFLVYLDAATNQYLIGAQGNTHFNTSFDGLHGDSLYLIASYLVRGREKTHDILLDTKVQPHNSSRFGFGS